MIVYGESHIGCIRKENQDAYRTVGVRGGMLAVLCDGMGGAAGGRIAADLAVEVFCREFSSAYEEMVSPKGPTDFDVHRVYSTAIYKANRAVFERAITVPQLKGMGTTLVVAFVYENSVYAASIGDSRIYHQGAETFVRMTHDDSLVQQKIDEGTLTEEEARESHERHLLTRALGVSAYADFRFYSTDIVPGDRLLLCSDGLTAYYRDKELEAVMQKEDNCAGLVKKLIEGACIRGGQDNITVICLQAEK